MLNTNSYRQGCPEDFFRHKDTLSWILGKTNNNLIPIARFPFHTHAHIEVTGMHFSDM
jgi:hypothetical protein